MPLILTSILALAACSDEGGPEPASTTGTGTTNTTTSGESSGPETGESGETGPVVGETGETTGEEPSTTTSDEEDCEWTSFASQYGISGTQGPSCGNINGADAAELDAILTCLNEALDAGEAANARVDVYGAADSNVTLRWYVRPAGETPRIFEVRRIQEVPEEGPSPDPSYRVDSCTALVAEECEDLPTTGDLCTACEGSSVFSCDNIP